VRKNGANGTSLVWFTEGATGQKEDATHTDSFVATDDINFSCVAGAADSGSITYRHIGVMVLNAEPSAFVPRVMMF
jgi:hypothetical protein